jgi:hypothetical protein
MQVCDIVIDVGEIMCSETKWIELAQNRVQWQIFVYMIMTLRVPWKRNSLPT